MTEDSIHWEIKSPAFQLYARDVVTDLDLMKCSWAAQGVWFRCLCLMWLAPVRGHLDAENRAQLCRIIGGSYDELSPLIDELITQKVASSNGEGSLINRRMYRQAKLKQTRSKAGQKGGKTRVANLLVSSDSSELCSSKSSSKPSSKNEAKPRPSSSSSSSSSSTSIVRTKSKDIKSSNREPSPIVDGCVYFRMDEREKYLIQKWYTENSFPLELIPFAISEVDGWLERGNGTKALKARNSPTHFNQLRAAWVIENATRLLPCTTKRNAGSKYNKAKSITEHNTDFLNNELKKLGVNIDGTRTSDTVIEVTASSISNNES